MRSGEKLGRAIQRIKIEIYRQIKQTAIQADNDDAFDECENIEILVEYQRGNYGFGGNT